MMLHIIREGFKWLINKIMDHSKIHRPKNYQNNEEEKKKIEL